MHARHTIGVPPFVRCVDTVLSFDPHPYLGLLHAQINMGISQQLRRVQPLLSAKPASYAQSEGLREPKSTDSFSVEVIRPKCLTVDKASNPNSCHPPGPDERSANSMVGTISDQYPLMVPRLDHACLESVAEILRRQRIDLKMPFGGAPLGLPRTTLSRHQDRTS